jgi:hypothetical protein
MRMGGPRQRDAIVCPAATTSANAPCKSVQTEQNLLTRGSTRAACLEETPRISQRSQGNKHERGQRSFEVPPPCRRQASRRAWMRRIELGLPELSGRCGMACGTLALVRFAVVEVSYR